MEKNNINTKALLTIDEVHEYTGLSKSYIYKLTSQSILPYHKPLGKKIFIDRLELETFLRKNRIKSIDEIKSEVVTEIVTKKRAEL